MISYELAINALKSNDIEAFKKEVDVLGDITVVGDAPEYDDYLLSLMTAEVYFRPEIDFVPFYSYVMSKGGDLNISSTKGMGESPLWTAAFEGHRELADCLLSLGADINFISATKQAPIHAAVIRNDGEMVEHLLGKPGIDLSLTYLRQTPVELAKNKKAKDVLAVFKSHGIK